VAEYTLDIPVRFGDCDPAGILYYPRYFDLYHQTMEQWFSDALGLPYADVLRERKIGVPTVSAKTEYRAPLEFGDIASVTLRIEEIGTTSLRFVYEVRGPGGRLCAEAWIVTVWMDLNPAHERFRRSIPAPPDVRAQVERFRDA
jgi:4-hydroxybenzoyl-CoA thioesterase